MRKGIHVAMLADVPSGALDRDSFRYEFTRPQPTPVFNLLEACLANEPALRFTVLSTDRACVRPAAVEVTDRLTHVVVPAPRGSGSATAYLPRVQSLTSQLSVLAPDVIHAQGADREFGLAAVRSGRPHVVTLHGLLGRIDAGLAQIRRPWSWRIPMWVETYVLNRCENAVAISGEAASYIGGRSRARQFRIPNGVPDQFFADPPSCVPEVLRLAVVGSIYPLKRTHVAIEAVKALQMAGVDARLDIVGAAFGPGSAGYADFCSRLAADAAPDSVVFHGWLSSKGAHDVVAGANALLQLSTAENCPMAVIEGLAIGVPVIGAPVGILPELIDERNGRIVADVTASAVADAVLEIRAAGLDWRIVRDSALPFSSRAVSHATAEMYSEILRCDR
jgi:glycosyltransferase involved in cell wall biosynthesis